MEEITSTQNPKIKHWRRLLVGKGRRRYGEFLVEGAYEWELALSAGVEPDAVLVCPAMRKTAWASERSRYTKDNVPEYTLSPEAFQKISGRENPDGLIGVARRSEALSSIPEEEDALLLVVNRLEKPGNLGALLRTAAAVGVAGVVNCNEAVDFEHPHVIRSSRGLVFSLPRWSLSVSEAKEELKSKGYRFLAAREEGPLNCWEVDWSGRLALLLGEEHSGLPEEWSNSEPLEHVSIPMQSGVDSLNVSVSGAILMYEWFRRRVSTDG